MQSAVAAGANLQSACRIAGISSRTYQRWLQFPDQGDQRRGPRTPSKHKLSPQEEQDVLRLVNLPEYRNLSPEQIVAKAADNGIYIASERTMRRVLKRHRMDTYRERSKPSPQHKPRQLVARGALEVLTWDITYLRQSLIRGGYFYLYLFVDIWSRRIVGFEVHEMQSSDLAAKLLQKVCAEHGIEANATALHSDNGGPMKGATMLATMHALGIIKSFSRPGVSNDNPFVESLFRHLKYAPSYPSKGFESVEAARAWVSRFVSWYNEEHLHSSIAYVTPSQRHTGQDVAVLDRRRRVYELARQTHPLRWSRHTRAWKRPEVVLLNPDRTVETTSNLARTAA